jgi:hypothetical protein
MSMTDKKTQTLCQIRFRYKVYFDGKIFDNQNVVKPGGKEVLFNTKSQYNNVKLKKFKYVNVLYKSDFDLMNPTEKNVHAFLEKSSLSLKKLFLY